MNIGMMLSPNMSFVKGGARMDLKPNSFQGQSINSAFRSLLVESVTSKNTSADIAAPSNFLTELFGGLEENELLGAPSNLLTELLAGLEEDELLGAPSNLLTELFAGLEEDELLLEMLMLSQAELEQLELDPDLKVKLDDIKAEFLSLKELHENQLVEPSQETEDLEIALKGLNVVELSQDTKLILQQLEALVMHVKEILPETFSDAEVKNIAAELLALMKEWHALEKQLDNSEDLGEVLDKELTDKQSTIWKQLVDVYEKRNQLSQNGQYQSNASVTKSDISNWLQQAFNHYESQNDKVVHLTPGYQATTMMSEVEQYVIHASSTDKVEEVSDKLIRQFTNILKASQFTNNNRLSELHITLRPEHLGNMTVKMAKVDGEMVVRILVNSLATKGILEANLDQLRHAFSPHQVIIERDGLIIDEQMLTERENEEELKENDSSNEQEEKQDKEQSENLDFQKIFSQLNDLRMEVAK